MLYIIIYIILVHISTTSPRAQTVLRGVMALCYGVDNKVPQLHATQSEPLKLIQDLYNLF